MRIRINNSNLFIEKGRHSKLAVEKRICPLCKSGVEDELHFSIKCIKLTVEREVLFKNISDIVPSFSGLSERKNLVLYLEVMIMM